MHLHPLLRAIIQATLTGIIVGIGVLWWIGPPQRLPVAPASYAVAVDRAAPAVVNIYSTKIITERPRTLLDSPEFRQFFGFRPPQPKKRLESSLGSGVIIDRAGHLITNHHVIAGADDIQVALRDGRTASARIIGTDPETDIAVLAIELDDLPTIRTADPSQTRVGDVVLAIGNPFGVGQTVTMGIISATGRNHLGINTFEDFIQTDAAINPGNSGGALINPDGALIGINTVIYSRSGGSQGIGFAIPGQLAQTIADAIIEKGYVERGWLGIDAQDASNGSGIVISRVHQNSPAAAVSLRPGDQIVSIANNPISSAYEALNLIARTKPGTLLQLGVRRQNQLFQVPIPVALRPQVNANNRR